MLTDCAGNFFLVGNSYYVVLVISDGFVIVHHAIQLFHNASRLRGFDHGIPLQFHVAGISLRK